MRSFPCLRAASLKIVEAEDVGFEDLREPVLYDTPPRWMIAVAIRDLPADGSGIGKVAWHQLLVRSGGAGSAMSETCYASAKFASPPRMARPSPPAGHRQSLQHRLSRPFREPFKLRKHMGYVLQDLARKLTYQRPLRDVTCMIATS